MAKAYSKKQLSKNDKSLKASKETINFLLSYSKSLSVIKSDNYVIEINKN